MNERETILLFVGGSFLAYGLFRLWQDKQPLPAPMTNTTPAPPTLSVNTPVQSSGGALDTFCLAIRDYEGKPGNLNYRNNNPGNVQFSHSGYDPSYGTIGNANGFAKFQTYADGWRYLQHLVLTIAGNHPSYSFVDFFKYYAPSSDHNNPIAYANFVANRCGVSPSTNVKAFLSGEGTV